MTKEEELNQDWDSLVAKLHKRFGKKPSLQSILFLIGHRELGQARARFSKEEKQDLIHVGTCSILQRAGYYRYVTTDADGWPHYELVRGQKKLDGEEQEKLLKKEILRYFETLNK